MTGLDALVGRREITSPTDMEALGEQMGRMLRPGDLVVLTGALGAGKARTVTLTPRVKKKAKGKKAGLKIQATAGNLKAKANVKLTIRR